MRQNGLGLLVNGPHSTARVKILTLGKNISLVSVCLRAKQIDGRIPGRKEAFHCQAFGTPYTRAYMLKCSRQQGTGSSHGQRGVRQSLQSKKMRLGTTHFRRTLKPPTATQQAWSDVLCRREKLGREGGVDAAASCTAFCGHGMIRMSHQSQNAAVKPNTAIRIAVLLK